MKTYTGTLFFITSIATVLAAHAADPVGTLGGRPKTPVYESAAAYEHAVRLSKASMEAADSLISRAAAAKQLGNYREARLLVKASTAILHGEAPLDVQLRKATVCAPHAGTKVSVGMLVKTAHFTGYEVTVIEGPERRCKGVVDVEVLSLDGVAASLRLKR